MKTERLRSMHLSWTGKKLSRRSTINQREALTIENFFRTSMNVGAVAAMRNIKDAIAVARHVLENTQHSFLVGERATEFALKMGFKNESLTTNQSHDYWQKWKQNKCQPNFWTVSNAVN